MPFTWPIPPATGPVVINVTGDSTGWYLTSNCAYEMYYGPNGPEPVFRLTIQDELMDKVTGRCQDFDGDSTNDHAWP